MLIDDILYIYITSEFSVLVLLYLTASWLIMSCGFLPFIAITYCEAYNKSIIIIIIIELMN